MRDRRRSLRAVAALAALAMLLLAAPSYALAGESGTGGITSGRVAIGTRPVAMDLYARGDFVSQTNLVQCVGASMQMMLNMIGPTDDRTATTQLRLFGLARALADRSTPTTSRRPGATAAGWARGLTASGGGMYVVRSAATRAEALTLAAAAIERTGRPVGLLMWQGAHAWVMSGFEATADPATDASARVTAVRVLDPLYPRSVGGPWGPGPAPDARLTVDQLAHVFVPYRPHGRTVALRGRFVLVLPIQASFLSRTGPLPV
jgi:hypothetical protein